jgi:hypothetical protein
VGDVAEEAFLAVDEGIESLGHAVDGVPEMAEFVAPCEVDAGAKFALGDTLSGAGEAFEAARDAADER